MFKKIMLICLLITSVTPNLRSQSDVETPTSPFTFCQDDPNPIGGGANYDAILSAKDATIHIEKFTGIDNFKKTIESATSGDIIFIDGNLIIDLSKLLAITNEPSIKIPGGVTVASDRGISNGALIFTDDFDLYLQVTGAERPIFIAGGDNVRITGLRFKGPFQGQGTNKPQDSIHYKACIEVADGYEFFEADNCTFYGWPYKAIRIGRGVEYPSFAGNKIHHCYFYNNRQMGLGYGVGVDCGYAEIYANIFKANRHDIAGSGKAGSGYEAYCNTILEGGTCPNFDMHEDHSTKHAGRSIYIHHNDFQDTGSARYQKNTNENIWIRARPLVQCRIENNRFAHESPEAAIMQESRDAAYGNMLVWNNIYTKPSSSQANKNLNKLSGNRSEKSPPQYHTLSKNPFLNSTSKKTNSHSYEFTFGDQDMDGKQDILKLEDGNLYKLPFDANQYSLFEDWELVQKMDDSIEMVWFNYYNSFSNLKGKPIRSCHVKKYGL